MKKLLIFVLSILMFGIVSNVNAQTKLELDGKDSVDYGNTISYDVILKTDEDVNGFQFDLDIDSNLKYLSYQSNIEGLIVKVSNDKTRIIGYGKTLKNNDNLLTIVFDTKELTETTNVKTKISNDIYVGIENNQVTGNNNETITTKVVVPVQEEETTTNTTSNTTSSNSSTTKKNTTKVKKEEVKIKDNDKKEEDKKETKKENKISKIVKIVIIILLGLLILFLLNKESNKDDAIVKEQPKKDKK